MSRQKRDEAGPGYGLEKDTLLATVPISLRRDSDAAALEAVVAEALAARLAEIDRVRTISNIDGLEEAVLDVGGSVLRGVTDPQLNSGVELRSAYWYTADSSIISVTKDADDPLLCRVEAKAPGTAKVTGWLTIQAPTYLYGNVSTSSLSVTVSFPVTVREPEEADLDTPSGVLSSKGSLDETS